MWAKEFSIGEKFIGDDHPTFIIAEAGDNHNGDIKLAKKLIDVAYKSGLKKLQHLQLSKHNTRLIILESKNLNMK